MAYKVVYSHNAQNEIREILDFVVADNFSEYLVGTIEMLTQQPYVGRKHDFIQAIREFSIKPHYLVYYSVLEEYQIIHVLNVVDSRRKW